MKKKRVIIIVFILSLTLNVYGKIGIHLIPAKAGNKEAVEKQLPIMVDRIIEDELSFDLQSFNVVADYKQTLKELERRMTGLVKGKTEIKMAGIDYFIIPTVSYVDGEVIADIRVMDVNTTEVVFAEGITSPLNKAEDEIDNLMERLIYKLKGRKLGEGDANKDSITVFKIEEEGNKGIGEAVAGMFFSGLKKDEMFKTVEKEGSKLALQQKELEFAGLIEREPLKDAKKISGLKLSLEGVVVTRNEGLITMEIKLIDVEKSKMLFSVYRECGSVEELRQEVEKICDIIEKRYFKISSDIEIVTRPSRANLYIRDEYYGRTPVLISDAEPGRYNFIISKAGYEESRTNVVLVKKQSIRLRIRLKKMSQQQLNNINIANKNITKETKEEEETEIYKENKYEKEEKLEQEEETEDMEQEEQAEEEEVTSAPAIRVGERGKVQTIGGIEFVYIRGGEFMMGSPDSDSDANIDEKPRHKVYVDSFWIGKYEVTQSQYEAIMGENPSYFKGANRPVERVSWNYAIKFCRRFSEKYGVKVRLPYEAEWEYAARAGTITRYYWGDEIDGAYCWYSDNSERQTHPVGQKKPNAWGLYDMLGNVWEWCMDGYDENYYNNSPYRNPHGLDSGSYRVNRGGSWNGFSYYLRCAYRGFGNPSDRYNDIGFRLVRTQ